MFVGVYFYFIFIFFILHICIRDEHTLPCSASVLLITLKHCFSLFALFYSLFVGCTEKSDWEIKKRKCHRP